MKKILSIFLLSTLLFNLLSISFLLILNNNKEFNFSNYSINLIRQHYSNKKKLRKIQQRKLVNFIRQKKKAILLNNLKLIDSNNKKFKNDIRVKNVKNKLNENQKSYCVFKKRWCGYWKAYISQQDWNESLKIINKIFSTGVKIAKLGKIIAVDLISLFMLQVELIKATITTIVAIILKLLEEGFTMICSMIENNKPTTYVIVKLWMTIPFWVSFR